MSSRSKVPYFFLALAAVLAVSAVALLILRPGVHPSTTSPDQTPAPREVPLTPPTRPQEQPAIPTAPTPPRREPPTQPADVVNELAQAIESGNLAAIDQITRQAGIDPATIEKLKSLAGKKIKLRPDNAIHEIGELELNARTRWAIELDGQPPGQDRILLDLRRNGSKWMIDRLTLPPEPGESPSAPSALNDPLAVADAFLQAVLNQNFEPARAWVDSAMVSDAKIAGLCILFEEGNYHLRKTKPLRAMFQRQDTVGYLANVEANDPSQNAQFSLTLKFAGGTWRVTEINLDQLLADYARRVAGGDVFYSPLVKNPAGGDTLALYFEFDEDSINPRTRRQLEIVSRILRSDASKKLTLSGHTDALGTEDYNSSLSARRAKVVRDYLTTAGVDSAQITTVAKGASQPRRPNLTETGADSPEGRRANRRTEIYLDF